MKNMFPVHAIITGFDGIDETGSGLSVARALKAALGNDITCTALVNEPVSPAAWMGNAIDKILLRPDWQSNPSETIIQLIDEAKSHQCSALIPGSTLDALAFAEFSDQCSAGSIRMLQPGPDGLNRITNIADLNSLCGSIGISTPASSSFDSRLELRRAAPVLAYPVRVAIGAHTRLMHSPKDLLEFLDTALPESSAPVIATPVTYGSAYRFAGIAVEGRVGPRVVARVNGVTRQGGISSASAVDYPELEDAAEQLTSELRWTGPIEIEIVDQRYNDHDAQDFVLTDVQCRLPSWTMLCHWSGQNIAEGLVHYLREGQFQNMRRARMGTMSVRTNRETTVPVERYRNLRSQRYVDLCGESQRERSSNVDKPVVAVTGLSSSDVINPGLGVARALACSDQRFSIVGLGYSVFDAGNYEPAIFDRVHRLDFPSTPNQQLRDLATLAHEFRIDVLIPCLDGELEFFAQNAEALNELGIATLLPSVSALRNRSKLALFGPKTKRQWGRFRIPESVIVGSKHDLADAIAGFDSKAVMKGVEFQCIPIGSLAEAKLAWYELAGGDQPKAIVQERLSGPSYAVSVVCNQEHEAVSTISIRKTAQCPRGSTWSAVRVDEPELERDFAAFLRSLKWVGPAEGEFIRDGETNQFALIEVNPRFTGWISFASGSGLNQPEILVNLAQKTPLRSVASFEEKIFMRTPDEIRVPATRLAEITTKRVINYDRKTAV